MAIETINNGESGSIIRGKLNSNFIEVDSKAQRIFPNLHFQQKGVYFEDSKYPSDPTGSIFDFTASGVSASWRSLVLKVLEGETVELVGLSYGVATKNIYIVDMDGYVIDYIQRGATYTGSYIATEDIYICLSTQSGYVDYRSASNHTKKVLDDKKMLLALEFVEGVYLSPTGGTIQNSSWKTSDYMPINGLDSIEFTLHLRNGAENESVAKRLAFYGDDFAFISGVNTSELVLSERYFSIAVPDTAKYYRCMVPPSTTGLRQAVDAYDYQKALPFEIPFDWTDGFFLSSQGLAIANGGWKISEFIAIDPTKAAYELHAVFAGGAAPPSNIAFYSGNSESAFISAITNSDSSELYLGVLTIPEGTKYIRFSDTISNDGFVYFRTNNQFGLYPQYTSTQDEVIDIVVPKYLDAPIGRQTDVFIDGIVAEPDDMKKYPLQVKGASILRIGENQLRYTPSVEESLTLYFRKYNDAKQQQLNNEELLIFRSVPIDSGSGEFKNICISGDSLIDGTFASAEAFKLLNDDGDYTINQIGTRSVVMNSVTYKHEGRGSWSWSTYVNPTYEDTAFAGLTNAFMSGGQLDFQQYMADNFPSLSGIDIFIMALGTNDVTQGSSYPSDTKIAEIIADAKTFIDALLSPTTGYPGCKVVVGLPGVGSPTFISGSTDSTIFKMAIQKLNRAYIDEFDNGTYHANVTTVMHGAYINRYHSYQHEDVALSDYIPGETERRWINNVHPLPIGYQQWGRGYYGKLRAILNGLL